MNICFIHLRNHEKDSKGNPVLLNYGGATIAYTVHRMADSLKIVYAVAECHEKDRFVKAIGRLKATKRLEADNIFGELEINSIEEDDIELLIYCNYLEYKAQYFEREDGEIMDAQDLAEILFPHKAGFSYKDVFGVVDDVAESEICAC